MFLHVTEAKCLHGHTLWLRFNDGTEGEIDLRDELEGTIAQLSHLFVGESISGPPPSHLALRFYERATRFGTPIRVPVEKIFQRSQSVPIRAF